VVRFDEAAAVSADATERARLLTQLQRQLRELLAPMIGATLDELESRLFDLAERSRVGVQQQSFFDGLRECRRKRADVEHEFNELLSGLLRPANVLPARARAGLTLVANEELEETLSLSAMADRVAARHQNELTALDERIALLLGQPVSVDGLSRIGPQAISNAFRVACQRLDVGIEIRLVAYTLFGHHVLGALDRVYRLLNATLQASGMVARSGDTLRAPLMQPNLTLRVAPPRRRRPNQPPRAARDDSAADRDFDDASGAIGAIDAMQELLGELRSLLANGARAASPPADPLPAANDVDPGEHTLPPRYVIGALDRLQDFRGEPRGLKSELLAKSRYLRADGQAFLSEGDEETVDMVGLVFDFMRHDPNLPELLQPLFARLQIPFLKAALTDPELVNAPDHPARRLIDELGELALGWSPGSDPERQVPSRIAQTIEALLEQGSSGPPPFERAMQELRTHLDAGRRRAELAEQRAVEAALGRERLRIARSRVAATLQRRLAQHSTLPWVRQLLRGPWANYLVLLWLRHGESSESYRSALAFVDELLWCDEQGNGHRDDARLRTDATRLGEDLRHGLSTVAYHDREIERLTSELHQFITALQMQAPLPAFVYEIDPKLGTADFAQTWVEHEIEDQPGADQVDGTMVARVRSLAPGTWFEFGGSASGERAKLSWSSPFSGRCLMVNRNGLRVSEIAPERLAAQIERGVARILENSRLLHRALQTLLQQTRSQGDSSAQPSA
jgi:hypothetical protein